jgi:hypothetical protein
LRRQEITFGEMRYSGVRGILIYLRGISRLTPHRDQRGNCDQRRAEGKVTIDAYRTIHQGLARCAAPVPHHFARRKLNETMKAF